MKLVKNLGVLAIGIVLGLIVVEVTVRILWAVVPTPKDSVWVPDPYTTWRIRPTPAAEANPEVFINSLGFRDREHPIEKPKGTWRVLGVGDSFVWGAVPVEQNFLRVTERELRAGEAGDSSGVNVDVMLVGLGGFSPEHYVGVIKDLGKRLDPDLVVLNLFVGNDLHLIQVRGTLFRGRRFYVGSPDPWLNAFRHSKAFVLAEYFFFSKLKYKLLMRKYKAADQQLTEHAETTAKKPAASERDAPYLLNRGYMHIQRKRFPVYHKDPGWRIEKYWREAEGYLDEFDTLCREAGVPWMLNLIPTEVQVDAKTRRRVMALLDLDAADYDFDLPQNRVKKWAETRGVPVLDPLEAMRALHRDNDRLYVPNNTHWNERGNDLAGRMLAEFIQSEFDLTNKTPPGR